MRAVLSTGANLGDVHATLAGVVEALRPELLAASPVWRTPPWGVADQPSFRNQILLLDTADTPRRLLERCQELEHAARRVRERRWGPRTLDVDIIQLRDDAGREITSADPLLTLPHPRAHLRAFVLAPWLDVEPGARLGGRPVAELLAGLDVAERAGLEREEPA